MELTLFLPVYAVFLMLLLTLFSFARTKGEVAIESRHQAWMERSSPIDQKRTLDTEVRMASSIGRVLNGDADPTSGLVKSEAQKDATMYLKTMNLFTNLEHDHYVFSDSWNHTTMPFEQQGSHSRLTLDRRAGAIATVGLDVFANLVSWKSGVAAIIAQNNQLNALRNSAIAQIGQAANVNLNKISEAREQLSSLQQQLSEFREAVPPDPEAIRNKLSEIRNVERRLRTLSSVANKLNQAKGMAFETALPAPIEQ